MAKHYSPEEVRAFLRSVSVASIAVSNDGIPISSIVLFALDDDFTMYFGTHGDTYKSRALKENPKISLSVWEHKKMLVQIDAKSEQIEEPSEAEPILDKIVNATKNIDNFWPPVLQLEGDEYAVFRITPSWIRVLDLTDDTIHPAHLPFQTIL